MRELGLQGESVTLTVSGGIGIVQFLAVLPAIVFIDRLGMYASALCPVAPQLIKPRRTKATAEGWQRRHGVLSLLHRHAGQCSGSQVSQQALS